MEGNLNVKSIEGYPYYWNNTKSFKKTMLGEGLKKNKKTMYLDISCTMILAGKSNLQNHLTPYNGLIFVKIN